MSPGRSIAVVGATGLVGNECLRLLLEHPAYDRLAASIVPGFTIA